MRSKGPPSSRRRCLLLTSPGRYSITFAQVKSMRSAKPLRRAFSLARVAGGLAHVNAADEPRPARNRIESEGAYVREAVEHRACHWRAHARHGGCISGRGRSRSSGCSRGRCRSVMPFFLHDAARGEVKRHRALWHPPALPARKALEVTAGGCRFARRCRRRLGRRRAARRAAADRWSA